MMGCESILNSKRRKVLLSIYLQPTDFCETLRLCVSAVKISRKSLFANQMDCTYHPHHHFPHNMDRLHFKYIHIFFTLRDQRINKIK